MSTMPAAAIPVGAKVHIDNLLTDEVVTVADRLFGTPRPGRLVLVDTDGRRWPFGGADKIEVVK